MDHVSKTEYLLFKACKKNAWLKIHRPDVFNERALSEFDKTIIEAGNEVESYARKLFPQSVLIQGRDSNAQELTLEHVNRKTPVMLQPVFAKDGFMAALDILKFNSRTTAYSVYEVKASNSIKETHLTDLAFQWALLSGLRIPVESAYIIHLNPEYVRDGQLDVQQLFKIIDVSSSVQKLLPATRAEMRMAQEYLMQETEPFGPCDCIYKGRSGHCSTFKYSNPKVPEYGVHDITRIGRSKEKLKNLVDKCILRLEDLPNDLELSTMQRGQISAYLQDRIVIREDKIAEELRKISEPLYFLDYETSPEAVPRFPGFSPYQQIPFQYSLHIFDSTKAEPLRHEEFLSTTPDDPSEALCASLRKHVGDSGSVVVWNKQFECTINAQLAQRVPAARPFLDGLNDRAYDLMDIFSEQYYVHKGFRGGTSIKDVLPVLAPDLTYENLVIKEGGTASLSWNKITSNEIAQAEKDLIAANLRAYCKLDTYAMYVVWRHLKDLTEHI